MPRKTRKPQSLAFSENPERDEIQRIIPLGLTPDEARAWYRHNLMPFHIARAFQLFVIGFGVLAAMTMLRPLALIIEARMPFHVVVQHILFVLTGLVVAFGAGRVISSASKAFETPSHVRAWLVAQNQRFNKWGIPSFLAAALLVVYWNMPANWSAAAFSEHTHIQFHLTLFGVGILIFVGLATVPSKIRFFVPVAIGKVLGFVGIFLLISTTAVYPMYPVSQQIETGTLMVVIMLAIDVTLVPYWLYNYFNVPSGDKAPS